MTTKFYPVRVKEIEKTTADCAVISLDIDEALQPEFAFRQGQHVTLKAEIAGEEVRRSYSLCSSPLDQEWKIAVKRVPRGRFSTYVNEELHPGDVLEVMPPAGRFYVETAPDQRRHYVAFAAGSGITPILSIIRTHLEQEPEASFQLFYVNRNTSSIILREEVEALKNRYLDRFEVFHFLTREERGTPLFNGRLTGEKMDLIFRSLVDAESTDHYFICGPARMIFMIRDYLKGLGIAAKRIHFELFNTDGIEQKQSAKDERPVTPGAVTILQVIEGGKKMELQMPRNGGTILEAALEKQADLPFACKGGVCCTCKARLVEGEVEMEVNYALEEEQLAAGYILTCQAVPLTDRVTVDFDG